MERRMKLLRENRWCDYLKHPHHVLFGHMVQTAFLFFWEKALCMVVQMCMFCVWEKDADESSIYHTQEMANNIISYYLAFLNAVSIYRELQKLHMKFVIGKVLQESEFWATRKVILIDKLYIHTFKKQCGRFYVIEFLRLKPLSVYGCFTEFTWWRGKKSIKATARFQECYARCQDIHSSGMSLKSVVVGTYFCIDI